MIRSALISFSLCLLLFLSSCATNTPGQDQAAGDATRKAEQAPAQKIGHRVEAGIDTRAMGTLISYILTNAMDSYDRQTLNHVFERSVSGTTSAWINPDKANRYSIIPEPAFLNPQQDAYCRRVDIQAIIDGRKQKTTSTGCRNQNGQWQLR